MPNDLHAMDIGDGLMTETDTQYRNPTGEMPKHVPTDSGLFGRARTGRDHQMTRRHRFRFINRDLVIAPDLDLQLGPKGPHAVDKVPGERIVIVDEQQHVEGDDTAWSSTGPPRS